MIDKALDDLKTLLANHNSIKTFQKSEAKIKSNPQLKELSGNMKAYQQEAVLYEKIEKPLAQREVSQKADQLASDLSGLPIVQDYRDKMQDASDLLQYVTQSIQEKLNKELMK